VAYDEDLAQRLRELLASRSDVTERKMFGGIGFMVGGNMCVGVQGEDLIARVGEEQFDDALAEPHARIFDFAGRPSKGFLYVAPGGTAADGDLRAWLDRALAFVTTLPPKG
jgi:TfoX/Sxy family transcriptional regulator of competence genes